MGARVDLTAFQEESVEERLLTQQELTVATLGKV